MPVEWTGSGPELFVPLDRGRPLRVQLELALREGVRTGRLAAGEQLPSSRALARALGVSRGLVTESYAQLQAEGYLVTRPGSGTRVAACGHVSPTAPARPAVPPSIRVDFRPGIPDLASFPREQWSQALRRACREASNEELGYSSPYGSPALREVLAAYLRRVRGAVADPAHTIVCAGYTQGLQMVLRSLGDVRTVAFEDPGDPDHRAIADMLGLEVVPVPVDERGMDVDALAATGARAVVLTPAHQSPTGVLLTPDRRQALITWAASRDATIIEDDYDAEFRYDREPVGALQGLAPDRVALLGSVSKSLSPALRLGWIVAPPRLSEAVARNKRLADLGSPVLDQLALANLVRAGHYDRYLRRMRQRYAARRAALAGALARHAPGVELLGLAAGFHAVVPLPAGADERSVVGTALDRGVGLYGMGPYRVRDGRPQLVLGFGNLTPDAVSEGIATVADLIGG
ncbi:PLP-dependent aminotransferase family protein [Streptosporangium sp. NPDC023615]|uniref:MocR-like pyridoxine biosynthesis transcription factor PdxR n=1 Tax=Streptosporangium sp. NPDC023615 TaxID=3154794 RepID=UPI0034399BB4